MCDTRPAVCHCWNISRPFFPYLNFSDLCCLNNAQGPRFIYEPPSYQVRGPHSQLTQICYFSKHWVYFAFCHIKYTVYNFSKHFRDFLTTLAAQSPAQLTVRLRREYPGWTAHLNKWAHVRTSWSLSLPVLTPGCEDCSWSEARAG